MLQKKQQVARETLQFFKNGTSKLFPLIWSKFIFNTDKSKCAYSSGTDGIKCGNYFKYSVTKFQLLKQYTLTNDALCL